MDLQDFIQRNSRRLIALGIIIFALFAGTLLLSSAGQSASFWSAKRDLTAGTKLAASDLQEVNASLGGTSGKYFSSKAKLVGTYLTSHLAAGELISVSSIHKTPTVVNSLRDVPLGINKTDIPMDIAVGEYIDLYSIPQKGSDAALILSHLQVRKIDSRNSSMSGQLGIIVQAQPKDVIYIATAIQAGRIVLVRHA